MRNNDISPADKRSPAEAQSYYRLICGHAVLRSDATRTLVIEGEFVRFTPTEYSILTLILDVPNMQAPFAVLTQSALHRQLDASSRRLLDKHVDHIRSKIRPYSLNIHCIARFGYIILPAE